MSTTSSTIPVYALAMPNPFEFHEISRSLGKLMECSGKSCERALAEGDTKGLEHWVGEVLTQGKLCEAYTTYGWFLNRPSALPRLRAWAWGASDPGFFKRFRRASKKANRSRYLAVMCETDAREAMRCAMLAAAGSLDGAIEALRRADLAAEEAAA